MNNIKYITQITSEDLRKIREAVNLEVGPLIRIAKNGTTTKIFVDEGQLKVAMYAFQRNGGFNQSTSADAAMVSLIPPN